MSDQSAKSQNQNGSICHFDVIDCLHKDAIQFPSLRNNASIKQNCSNCGSYILQENNYVLKDNSMLFEADIAPIEIYEHLLIDEKLFSHFATFSEEFTSSAFILSLRKPLVEKIFEFGEKVKQRQLTIHVACAYLDILLQKSWKSQKDKGEDQTPINIKQQKTKFELKSIIGLLVASKYDELDDRIPLIRELQRLLKYQFSYQECKDEENSILLNMNWNLHVVTPLHFVQILLAMGVAFNDDHIQKGSEQVEITDHILKKLRKFSEYFANLAIKSPQMMTLRPSVVAISCILCARMVNKISPMWNARFEEMTSYKFESEGIEACFENLYSLHDESYRSVKKEPPHVQSSVISFFTQKTPDQGKLNISDTRTKSILEQNQNIMNDSNIEYEKPIFEQGPTPNDQETPIVEVFQSKALTNNIQTKTSKTERQASSNRSSFSQMCLQKVRPLHHVQGSTGDQPDSDQPGSSLTGSLVKRQSTTVVINKENQTNQSQQKQTQLESSLRFNEHPFQNKNLMPKSCRLSNNVSTCDNHPKTITFNLVSSKNEPQKLSANNSKIGTRATSNSSQPISQNTQFKQRNQSASNLHVNIVNNAKKQVMKAEPKSKNQNMHPKEKCSANSRIQTLRTQNNSKTRKPNDKPNPASQRPCTEKANPTIVCPTKAPQVEAKKIFPAKSSRNSSSIANQNKIEEIKNKYQSENTIYEKNALQNCKGAGRFFIKKAGKKGQVVSERSQSECSMENTLQNQFQTLPGDGGKNAVVVEEEEDVDKSCKDDSNSSDMTQQLNDEYQAQDESVVIKKPMSSKKSKSLENINKIQSKNKMNERAILELYRNQFHQSNEHIHQRNGTDISSQKGYSKSSTIDFANLKNATNRMSSQHPQIIGCQYNGKGKNFIQKNINYVSHLNQNLINNKNECSKNEEENGSKQTSVRRKNQSGSMLNHNQRVSKYSRISSNRLNTNKSLTSLVNEGKETEQDRKRMINSSMDHETEMSLIESKWRNGSQTKHSSKHGSSSHRNYKDGLGKKAAQLQSITNYKYSQGKRMAQKSPQVIQFALHEEEKEGFKSQNPNASQGSINYKINIYGSNQEDRTVKAQYSLQNTARCGSIKNNSSDFHSLFHKMQSRRQSGKQESGHMDSQNQHSTVLNSRSNSKVIPANSTKFQKFQSKKPVKKNPSNTNSLLEQVLIKKTQLQLQLSQANKTEIESNGSKLEHNTFDQGARKEQASLNSHKKGNHTNFNLTKNQSQLSLNTCPDSLSNQWLQRFKSKQMMGVVKSARGQAPKNDNFTPRDIIKQDGEGFAKLFNNFLGPK